LLRRAQYRLADDEAACCKFASHAIAAKVANSRSVLLRGARDTKDEEQAKRLRTSARRLAHFVTEIQSAQTLDRLRGLEGESASTYFSNFNDLIRANHQCFQFNGRNRRPPTDNINALMSFLYSMLCHDLRSACEASGLDAAVGLLHRDRPGRPGLALDLVEEFRPFIADRLMFSLINRKQVNGSDFTEGPGGAVALSESGRKSVLSAYQKRKQDAIVHPFLKEKTTIGLLPHLQARLCARHFRGDLDAYPAFIWK
jgi:CRISPR-associated protein Cas1